MDFTQPAGPSIGRRAVLAGFGAGAMTLAAPGAMAAPRRKFFERIGKPIGLQLYTLGEEPGKDLDGVLAKLAKIGFRDLQLPNLLGKKPAELKAAADRAGVRFSSLHLPMMTGRPSPGMLSLDSEPQRIADDLGALGVFNTAVPIAPFPPNLRPNQGETMQAAIGRAFSTVGADHWKRAADLYNRKAASLKPFGIRFGYHNHNIEFAPVGDATGWEILARETDPGLVFFEIDVGWVKAAGLDPVAFLKKYSGRVRWLHVKDVKAGTKPNFGLQMDPTEVGSGIQDWARIMPAARAAGCEHFYIEQEPPFSIPRMDAAAKGFAYLSKLRA